jgi:hypothetical protein
VRKSSIPFATRINIFLKEFSSTTKALVEIEKYPCILIFQKDLVAAYFIHSTIKSEAGRFHSGKSCTWTYANGSKCSCKSFRTSDGVTVKATKFGK